MMWAVIFPRMLIFSNAALLNLKNAQRNNTIASITKNGLHHLMQAVSYL
jgi:hypothetical protein